MSTISLFRFDKLTEGVEVTSSVEFIEAGRVFRNSLGLTGIILLAGT